MLVEFCQSKDKGAAASDNTPFCYGSRCCRYQFLGEFKAGLFLFKEAPGI